MAIYPTKTVEQNIPDFPPHLFFVLVLILKTFFLKCLQQKIFYPHENFGFASFLEFGGRKTHFHHATD